MLWLPTAHRAEPQVRSLTFKADPNLVPVCCSGKVYLRAPAAFAPLCLCGLVSLLSHHPSQVMLPLPIPWLFVEAGYMPVPPPSTPEQPSPELGGVSV